jgi:tetratricopeptide (TPR) repeat protein
MTTSSDSSNALALVHQGWDFLRTQRPLAAWAAWQRALRLKPDDAAALHALELLESSEELPAAAKASYRFRWPQPEVVRARWSAALGDVEMLDLDQVADEFRKLSAADESDYDALYNHAICLAWRGENARAVEALKAFASRVVEDQFDASVDACVLAEILAQGSGAESVASDLNHTLIVDWPQVAGDPLPRLQRAAVLTAQPIPRDRETGDPVVNDVRAFEWLDRGMPSPQDDLARIDLPRVLASVVVTPKTLRFSSPDVWRLKQVEWTLANAFEDVKTGLERHSSPRPIRLMDADIWTFRIPPGSDPALREQLDREAVERYFEDAWIHQPRSGLSLTNEGGPVTPFHASRLARRDGVPSRQISARLEATIRVREQLACRPRTAALYGGYPFDRLRCRLGLPLIYEATVDPSDVSCMNEDQLAELDPASLDLSTLKDGYRSAFFLVGAESPVTYRLARGLFDRDAAFLFEGCDPPVWSVLAYHAIAHDDREQALAILDRAVNPGPDPLTADPRLEAWYATLHGIARTESSEHSERTTGTGDPPSWASVSVTVARTLLAAGHPSLAFPIIATVSCHGND